MSLSSKDAYDVDKNTCAMTLLKLDLFNRKEAKHSRRQKHIINHFDCSERIQLFSQCNENFWDVGSIEMFG